MESAGSLPTGTVTFLFTDIEGSTRLWEQQPDAMRLALARHDTFLRAAIESNHGHVFKTIGDAFCAAFAAASDAVDAALAAQQSLRSLRPSAVAPAAGLSLRVRMALHTGEAEQREGDYFGPALNRVARLLAVAHGGQVVLSQATAELVRDDLPPESSCRDLGLHRLRDLQRPEQVYQLLHPDLPAEFPPLRSLTALPNNLPQQWTSFIGREREVAEVRGLLEGARLLTLGGAGGIGKTRLALQVAAELLGSVEDGAWLVELAPVSDPDLVPQVAATALGVREQPGKPLVQTLLEELRPRKALLVLDNCEHMLAACARLAEAVLRGCPEVRILTTSREGLGIVGEQTYRVPSMSAPAPGHLPQSLDRLAGYEAIRLFLDRAAQSRLTFTLTEENAAAVAQVCRRLDGIPLAIELAAARVKALPVEGIAERLDDRFRLLTGGSRTSLPRQQTLRATIDWSYDLLSEPERRLLRRLSAFAGGGTLEAAEEVCADGEIEAWEVLDLLAQLVDRSLVVYEEDGGEARYRLLETIRQYSRDRLIESGEAEAVRQRHAAFYMELAAQSQPHLTGAEQAGWLDRLEREHDNLWAALEWWNADPNGAAELLRLAGALWRFWSVRGHFSEGRRALERVLERAPGDDAALRRSPLRARCLDGAGALAHDQSDYPAASAYLEESLARWREIGDEAGLAGALNNRANLALDQGDYGRAEPLYEEARALYRRMGDTRGAGMVLSNLGALAEEQGDTTRAAELLAESLALKRKLGNTYGIAMSLESLGNVEKRRGDPARAAALYEEALALRRELRHKQGIAMSLCNLGNVQLARRDLTRAGACLEESLGLFYDLMDRRGLAECLAGLADVAALRGRHDHAARLYGAVASLRESLDLRPSPEEGAAEAPLIETARSALGEAAFQSAWSLGRALPLAEAVADARAISGVAS